jgi:hypothetical protein
LFEDAEIDLRPVLTSGERPRVLEVEPAFDSYDFVDRNPEHASGTITVSGARE